MEQIRIDRRELRLRARHHQERDAARAEGVAPLQYTAAPGGGDAEDDLLARIDEVLGAQRHADDEDQD
ncbi:MAG: hypothetical protein ABGZ36_22530 [Actinomycetota bacterium]